LLDFCSVMGTHLVIVDDGSKDGTGRILDGLADDDRVSVVRHKVNQGYGGALKSGIRCVRTPYLITVDADGQHDLADIMRMFAYLKETNADLVVGSRLGQRDASIYRSVGKRLIRWFARVLLPVHVYDLNSGMKLYDAELARRYITLCPDRMAFSEIMTMVFISRRHRVLELPITIRPRAAGSSTISTMTAIDTVREILNIVVLFNPMRVFLPISALLLVAGLIWEIPIFLRGDGVSVGAMLLLVTGVLLFGLGLIAEQLSTIRKSLVDR